LWKFNHAYFAQNSIFINKKTELNPRNAEFLPGNAESKSSNHAALRPVRSYNFEKGCGVVHADALDRPTVKSDGGVGNSTQPRTDSSCG
jgi:hypothetical protein